MGLSTAYHLALALGPEITPQSICVVERDLTYKKASAVLSAGGIRQQFSDAENIAMSLYGLDFIRNTQHLTCADGDEVDMQFVEGGYLFLGSDISTSLMQENNAVQHQAGCDWVHLLQPTEIMERFPWLKVDDIALGSLGTINEGWFDPWSLISSLRRKIAEMGVTMVEADVVGLDVDGARICKAHLRPTSNASRSGAASPDEIVVRSHLVNAAGAWADRVVQMACAGSGGDPAFPVRPRPRHIFHFHCPDPKVDNSPLVIDPSGVYFRREGQPSGNGGYFICGVSPPNEHQPAEADLDAEVDWRTDEVDYTLFEQLIWPTIATRVPTFEQIKLQSAWTGLYEYNTFDQNAIIGHHHLVDNMVLCNGFSGHGLQQSPAAGRAVSELLLEGAFQSIDLSPFAYERVLEGRPLLERQIV
jgi:FAD-dependent oxidoreductase domain-containing protein 1